jgi:hypothetical protein
MDNSSTLIGNPSAQSAIRHVARRLRRVASMGVAEAGYRGWQESAKWIDRRRIERDSIERVDTPGRDAVDAVFRERFFPGVTPESIAELRRLFPEACQQIREEADGLLAGRFDLLGYRNLWFGEPIDWQLDPVWSRRAPLVHWSEIDPLNAALVGDSKIAWELSRHQWVVRLAQAAAITGDTRYATAAVDAIDHWIETNPVGRGLNWASSLEVAFRLIAWTWVLALLRDSSAMSATFSRRLFAAIHAHAAHVRKYLSYYFSPNTHLTGEALGLFYAGTMFPHFRDAAGWRATGARILIDQSRIQVTGDGVYFEQSTGYERYTCEFYLHFLLLAERAGIAVPADVRSRLLRMFDFLVAMRRPDGSMPLVGDADDGCLMPLVRRAPEDFRGAFAVAAAMFRRPDYADAAGGPTPEVLWLLGPGGVRQITNAGKASPAPPPSQVFAHGGYAVMRNNWDRDAHQLIVDVGPLGCHVSGGHGHEDLLAIQCSVFGDPALIDPGTYGYSAEPQWRNYFRSAAAHSTVMVDGLGQSEPAGPFAWRRRPRAVLREWITTPQFDLVDAEHNAYTHLVPPVIHRRRVMFVKPDFWVLIDDITGAGRHAFDCSFQIAPLAVELSSDRCRVETERGAVLWIMPFASAPLELAIRNGELQPARGWISDRYGHKQPSPALVCSAVAALPIRLITVLFPARDRAARAPAVETIFERGSLAGVEIAGCTVLATNDRVLLQRT